MARDSHEVPSTAATVAHKHGACPLAMRVDGNPLPTSHPPLNGDRQNHRSIFATEHVVTFGDAPKFLPRANGKRVNSAAIWRWARKGVKGIKLECWRLGGRFVTSIEAIERFSKALAELPTSAHCRGQRELTSAEHHVATRSTTTTAHRAAAISRAEQILSDAGI
jgi:hypothetical protein